MLSIIRNKGVISIKIYWMRYGINPKLQVKEKYRLIQLLIL